MPGWFEQAPNTDTLARRDAERPDDSGQANLHLVLSLAAIAMAAALSLL